MDKLYVNYKKKYKETPEEFFNRLYESSYGFPTTYKDVDCNYQQCINGSDRSFNDLYRLMKTYYPRITHKQLIKIINKKCTRNKYFNLIYCPDVNKIVLYYGSWGTGNIYLFNRTYYDYNGQLKDNKIKKIDKFTITYLYKKLGYTAKEIKEELKKLKQIYE